MAREGLSRQERLCRRQDYLKAYRQGTRFRLPYLTIIIVPNRCGFTRVGISVSRKIKEAVQRNRAKRLLREFFRRNKNLFPSGYDVVFVAKEGLLKQTPGDLKRDLERKFSEKWLRSSSD
ncbi:ribonuclease P protein component [Thermosulfuriphilus ammonigenes]|uniref:Ribonuclease P protein component n=1 Tax=Thermosulfuriphilus ammonigenes TaxID=1936021 RepID=A0A6G7PX74_9BACT|nr:ribonuclease P protein component [Thermosulfuriphilus ammonigenes]